MGSSCLGWRKQDYSFTEGVLSRSIIDKVDEETESISLHYTNSNLFQLNLLVNDSDLGDSKVFKSLQHSNPGTTEEIASSISRLQGQKTFPGHEDNNLSQLLEEHFSMNIS